MVNGRVAAVLGCSEGLMTPNELITTILQAPVDLLWNGGIGTYVKASSERHEEVGDRANDGVRIDADELRCRVWARAATSVHPAGQGRGGTRGGGSTPTPSTTPVA
jgi:NAD-specific glutamate dehydrogenase